MKKINIILSMFLAAAVLGSCSYDSSEIEGSITEL